MIPPPLVGVADPPSLAALELLWKARALRCLDLARMVFHIRVAHASSPFDPPVHEYAGCGWERLGQRILRLDTAGRPASARKLGSAAHLENRLSAFDWMREAVRLRCQHC